VDQIIEFLKGFNAQTLLAIAGIMWLWSRHFDAKLEAFAEGFKEQNKRIDRLYEMFVELLNKR